MASLKVAKYIDGSAVSGADAGTPDNDEGLLEISAGSDSSEQLRQPCETMHQLFVSIYDRTDMLCRRVNSRIAGSSCTRKPGALGYARIYTPAHFYLCAYPAMGRRGSVRMSQALWTPPSKAEGVLV